MAIGMLRGGVVIFRPKPNGIYHPDNYAEYYKNNGGTFTAILVIFTFAALINGLTLFFETQTYFYGTHSEAVIKTISFRDGYRQISSTEIKYLYNSTDGRIVEKTESIPLIHAKQLKPGDKIPILVNQNGEPFLIAGARHLIFNYVMFSIVLLLVLFGWHFRNNAKKAYLKAKT